MSKYNSKGIKDYKQYKPGSLQDTQEVFRFGWELLGKYPDIPFSEVERLMIKSSNGQYIQQ